MMNNYGPGHMQEQPKEGHCGGRTVAALKNPLTFPLPVSCAVIPPPLDKRRATGTGRGRCSHFSNGTRVKRAPHALQSCETPVSACLSARACCSSFFFSLSPPSPPH